MGTHRRLDLSTLTLALNGAEPVDPKAVEAFVAAAEPFGFTAGGVFPAFGMAETAIGAAFPRRGTGMVCDTVDREVLERVGVAKPVEVSDPDELALEARRLPLLGTAVPGMEMRVVDPGHVGGPGRASRRRAPAARHLGDAGVLQARGSDGGAVPRRLALHG